MQSFFNAPCNITIWNIQNFSKIIRAKCWFGLRRRKRLLSSLIRFKIDHYLWQFLFFFWLTKYFLRWLRALNMNFSKFLEMSESGTDSPHRTGLETFNSRDHSSNKQFSNEQFSNEQFSNEQYLSQNSSPDNQSDQEALEKVSDATRFGEYKGYNL